jgi:hypothetical protein
MSSFHVDGRVTIKLEYELAMRLGEFILNTRTEDKQFVALGHKLLNLDEEENPQSIIRSTGRVLRGVSNEPPHEEHHYNREEWSENPIPSVKTPIRLRNKYSKNI